MKLFLVFLLIFISVGAYSFVENAEAKKKAYFFYQRITGSPPDTSSDEFKKVWGHIETGTNESIYQAALEVTQDKKLINIKLKNFLKDWTNRATTKNIYTNDMVLLMLGLINDDRDFKEVLTTDDQYIITKQGMINAFPPDGKIIKYPPQYPGNSEKEEYSELVSYNLECTVSPDENSDEEKCIENSGEWKHVPYIAWNTNQADTQYNVGGQFEGIVFENLDNVLADLAPYLVATEQVSLSIDFPDTADESGEFVRNNDGSTAIKRGIMAGVMTSGKFVKEFYNGGTNRRATQYVFRNFLCKEFEEVMDTTVDTQYVRRDVDRYPNGDLSTYLNYCVGCHAGQDSLGRAFYHYEHSDNKLFYRTDEVSDNSVPYSGVSKINRVVNYEDGYIVGESASYSLDSLGNKLREEAQYKDQWENLWISGKNANLEFDEKWSSAILGNGKPHKGVGVKELGDYLSRSTAFSACMAKRMYEMVCNNSDDENFVEHEKMLTNHFKNNGHVMRKLIAKVATICPYGQ